MPSCGIVFFVAPRHQIMFLREVLSVVHSLSRGWSKLSSGGNAGITVVSAIYPPQPVVVKLGIYSIPSSEIGDTLPTQ